MESLNQPLILSPSDLEMPSEGNYIVAVSGGVDSVALLHLLVNYWLDASEPTVIRRLRVAHLDHGMRIDSGVDRRLVQNLAQVYGLPYHFHEVQLGQRAPEEVARQARYNFLQSVATSFNADGIITAHHADDRTETSIFNLSRGADRHGLAPMSRNSRGAGIQYPTLIPNSKIEIQNSIPVPILRPLLRLTKNDLTKYASHHHLPWREDSTNSDLTYTRNYIRHQLLPAARLVSPSFDLVYRQHLAHLDELNLQIDLQLEHIIQHGHMSGTNQFTLPRTAINAISPATLGHLVVRILNQLCPWLEQSRPLIDRAYQIIQNGQPGLPQILIDHLWVKPERATITFGYGKIDPHREVTAQTFDLGSKISFGNFILQRHQNQMGGGIAIQPIDLVIRTAQAGDRIAPIGMTGTKKLQDIFTDAKIPRVERLSYPIVASYNGEVVWVPGLASSRHFVLNTQSPDADYLSYNQL